MNMVHKTGKCFKAINMNYIYSFHLSVRPGHCEEVEGRCYLLPCGYLF